MAIGKSHNVEFEDNSEEILKEWSERKGKILYVLGLFFQSTITKVLTVQQQVITGRLRASITFVTATKQGKSTFSSPDSSSDDYITGSTDEDELIIGSNVKYARKVELTSRKGAFLRPGILNHREDAEKIVKQIMEE